MRQLVIAFALAIILALGVAELAFAGCNPVGSNACSPAPAPPPEPDPFLPFTYAQTISRTVPIYSGPYDEVAGIPPIRMLDTGFVWVSLADPQPVQFGDQFWYRVNPTGYIHAEELISFKPSTFQGIALPATPDKPIAWVINGVRISSAPGTAPAANAPRLAKYTRLTIYDERKVGDWTWYRIGDNQWVEQRQVGIVQRVARPQQIAPNDKWIEVNLYEQTLAAYEGDRMVYATLISSGLARWPTPTGLYRVWAKVTEDKMSGADGEPDYYYLEDVPWILYFNQSVALHGAYWHDRFGAPHSHGCVNLTPADAKWLFDWATPAQGPSPWTLSSPDNPGTWVWVH